MKFPILIAFLIFAGHVASAQNDSNVNKTRQKGKLYAYWGWNRGWYTTSDISFSGTDYDFAPNEYLNPTLITIPQFNFRLGYFIKDNWDISFGVDHMKYVVQLDQAVKISGHISGTETEYDGIYENNDIVIEDGFLLFEHTDGLNYLNVELRRFDNIFEFNKVKINLN